MEVHEAGGGINYTVEHTKKANEEELYTLLVDRLRRMIKSGKLETNKKKLCAIPSNHEKANNILYLAVLRSLKRLEVNDLS